jgi:hypothetical protein
MAIEKCVAVSEPAGGEENLARTSPPKIEAALEV